VVASSRLIFAVARDGVLPLSSWMGRVNGDGQPRNAVTVMFVFAAVLLFSILPSQVAFTSLISAGGVPTIAAYGLIALLRLTMTPHAFKTSHFYLGRWAKPMYVCAVLFNGLVFAVRSSLRLRPFLEQAFDLMRMLMMGFRNEQVMISPFYFPVTATTFNFSCVIFGAVTIFAILSWYFMAPDKWLRQEQIERALHIAGGHPDPM
jgi:amino acid transporter